MPRSTDYYETMTNTYALFQEPIFKQVLSKLKGDSTFFLFNPEKEFPFGVTTLPLHVVGQSTGKKFAIFSVERRMVVLSRKRWYVFVSGSHPLQIELIDKGIKYLIRGSGTSTKGMDQFVVDKFVESIPILRINPEKKELILGSRTFFYE